MQSIRCYPTNVVTIIFFFHILFILILFQVYSVEYRFPPDANILDVKRDFYAKGDGITNDTQAIWQAMVAALREIRKRRMIYLPKGTYLISQSLKARITDAPDGQGGWSDGWRCGLFMVGENREETMIRLKDFCPGFNDPNKPRAMIITGSTGHGEGHDSRIGGWGNEGFQNTLMNFTIHTGKGNPGAIGIDFLANNRGTLEEVTIISGDPDKIGVCGVDLTRAWPGPALVKNLLIDGFDYGIRQKGMDCSMTYEHITFKNQRKIAVYGIGNPFMSMRGFKIEGSAIPFVIEGNKAIINIVDSTCQYTRKGDLLPAAVYARCYLVLKNLEVDGYKAILNQEGLPQYHEEKGKDQQPDSKKESVTTKTDEISPSLKVENGKGKVSFFSLRGTTRLLPGEERIPNLPIKETPFFHHSDFTKWANPQNFRVGSQTAGIQEAIDSGAEIIYLPAGHYYFLQTTVIIRNNVRKIFGCEADITPPENRVVFRFDGVKSGMVIIEHIGGGGDVVHNCDQTLVIRKCDLGYRNTIRGTGDVFLEDGMFQRSQVLFPQNFWARQYNSEFGDRAQLTIRHATAWILGIKVEGNRHAIYNLGGTVECYGLYARTGGPVPGVFVENQEGWLAVSLREGGQGTHQIRLKDTWNKESKQVGGPREVGWAILGNPPTPSRNENLPPSPSKLKVQVGERKVNLSWSMEEKSTYPILYYAIYRNGQPWGSTEANQLSYVDEEVQERQQYRYEVRAVDIRGTHSKGAYQEVVIPPDTVPPQFIQALGLSDAPSTIVLDFNEPLLKSTLTQKENYIINPSIPIERITSNYEQTRIILSLFQAMKDGQNYTVTCKNLMDTSQAKNQLGESSKSFIFWEKGDGLKAEFWNGSFEGTPIVTEIHRTINFWWGDSSPHPQLQKDHFSCRWSGYLRPQKTGPHVFFLRVVGQKRLYLDDQLIIDVWGKGPEDVSCKPIELQSDQRYKITIETLHVGTPGGVRFYWRQPGLSENELPKKFNIPREIVNEDFLFTK